MTNDKLKSNNNKIFIFILVALFFGLNHVMRGQKNEWNDLSFYEVGNEPKHTTFKYFTNKQTALTYDFDNSPFYKSLNGTWKFAWYRKPADRIVNFFDTDFDASNWGKIKVPGDWQFQGYDVPIDFNNGYPFERNAPKAPQNYNPVGQYIYEFKVPKVWDGKQIYLHLAGVNSAFYIWLNGKNIGYHEDSKVPAEFNITNYITKGSNKIAIEVYRWPDGSYLEDQDFWRFSGIERDVYIYAANSVSVRNIELNSNLDEDYKNGLFSAKILLNNFGKKSENVNLNIELINRANKNTVYKETKNIILKNYRIS